MSFVYFLNFLNVYRRKPFYFISFSYFPFLVFFFVWFAFFQFDFVVAIAFSKRKVVYINTSFIQKLNNYVPSVFLLRKMLEKKRFI